MRPLSNKPSRGFTLIEVMFALTIIAVALFSLSRMVGQTLNHTRYLDEKLIASWVAQNVIAEAELNPGKIKSGTSKGVAEMAGQKWRWEQRVEKTPDPDLKRLEVSVSNGEVKNGASLVTLMTLTTDRLGTTTNRTEQETSPAGASAP